MMLGQARQIPQTKNELLRIECVVQGMHFGKLLFHPLDFIAKLAVLTLQFKILLVYRHNDLCGVHSGGAASSSGKTFA